MGDKTRARALAEEVGVPTVPGSPGEIHDAAEALQLARQIGLPVMLKAAHGGGGRGMRVVRQGAFVLRLFRLLPSATAINTLVGACQGIWLQ